MSNAQRSTLKWEKEETLGEMATVAPVLYTNQKARDNRAALRINKVQLSNESIKRQQHPQQPPDTFDPTVPLETEPLFKDPLKHKESEHEQEWKFRQQQGTASKDGFARPQLPGPPSSGTADDVFLRPPPPPPAGSRTPAQDSCLQGQSSQLQSPQVFSPGTSGSRPSSPWDPYAKMVGTPRPPPMGSSTPRRNSESGKSPRSFAEQPERGRPSPAHESFGSPTSMSNDPYAKPPDTPRPVPPGDPFLKPMGPPRQSLGPEQQGRHTMGSMAGDTFVRPALRNEVYQRMSQNRMILSDPYSRPLLTPIPGSNESGSVPLFKMPMPPPQSQDPYGSGHSGPRRGPINPYERPSMGPTPQDGFSQNQMNDPYAHPPLTPRPMNDSFPNPQRMLRHPQGNPFPQPGSREPQRDPYAHAPSTPRPDYSQSMPDPYAQPPGTPRPSSDPYAQPPGTPRPSSDPYAQMPGTPRPQPDPYSQPPGTPRPQSDPYAQPPGTPRPSSSPYPQPPSANPRPMASEQYLQQPQHPPNRKQSPSHSADPYAQPPGTPRPMSGERFSKSPGCQRSSDPYAHPPGTPRPLANDPYAQMPGTPRPVLSDPYAQPPGTPRPGAGPDGFNRPMARSGPMPSQDPFSPPQARMQETFSEAPSVGPADTEEKFRQVQRQRIRELILKQQQQKQSAVRQEKGQQEPGVAIGPGTPRHWSQENPNQPNDVFSRPPPPYPGTMRGPMRFPGPFPGDRRGPFPNEGHFVRPQYPGDVTNMPMRPHGQRFAFPPGGQGPHSGQERFLNPSHQMQPPMMDLPPQMRRSASVDLARSMGNNPAGLPQHFPPRGMPMQQHNIMGQPFIELRHRAPENRMRLPFGPPVMAGNVMDPAQRQPGLMGAPDPGFPLNQQGPRMMDPSMNQPLGIGGHMQMSASMENLHHQQPMQMNAGSQHPPLMRSQSHPNPSDTFTAASAMLLPTAPAEQAEEIPITTTDVIEEKLDTDDSAVKDLEDVEVKDLVDADLENLNLDPEDGKDLDLETNDLHLDDFLKSGKFDIIAYTDPELDLEDKKDMFNEELDLSDPIDDHGETSDLQKALSEKRNTSSGSSGASSQVTGESRMDKAGGAAGSTSNVKQESSFSQSTNALCSEQTIKTEGKDGFMQEQENSISRDQTNESALSQEGQGNGSNLSVVPTQQAVQPCGGALPGSTPVLSSLLIKEKTEDSQLGPMCSDPNNMTAPINQVPGMPQNPGALMSAGPIPEHAMNPSMAMGQMMDPSQAATLGNPNVMQTQPPCQNFGAPQPVDQVLPIGNQQLASGNISQGQQAMFSQGMGQQNRPLLLDEQPLLLQDLLDQERQEQQQQRQMQAMIRQRSSDSFFPNIDDAQKKQYEDWLKETQQLLQMQQKFLEEQIGAHRKSKKALSAKQRTAKKAGREFPEEDAEQLKHVTEQQGVVQKQLEQMQPHLGQPNQPPRMPNAPPPGWHPGAPLPMGAGPRMPTLAPPQAAPPTAGPAQPPQPPTMAGGVPAQAPGDSPHVKFDDNNPFSEGFQERERKERLREQQERQRVQLMQEVERQRALQQRLEMEQQGMLGTGADQANRGPLSQMPFYNSDMPHDFMPPQRPPQPPQQQQMGQMFPQQQGMQQGFMGPHGGAPYMQGGERRPMVGNGVFGPEMGPSYQPGNPALQGPNFAPGQPRPPRFIGPGMMMQGAGEGPPFGMDPATPLPPNYPGSGQSLIQLYSNIIPEEKGKKKRNRKKKKDEDAESVKAPSTPHSDLTAPLTPCVSDTSSTPTRSTLHDQSEPLSESLIGLPPPSELERQLSGGGGGGPCRQSETDRILSNIKLERVEASECHGPRDPKLEQAAGSVKLEEGKDGLASPHPPGHSPAHATPKGESGNELLKHLLKHKTTPPHQPALSHQRSDESLRSEDEESLESKVPPKHGSADGSGAVSDVSAHLQPEQDKKKQRNKRAPKSGDKPASRYKKRKKEEEERQTVYSSTDTLMTQLKQQLSLLPLMEPLIGVNFAHFPPYGSGQLNGESRLSGTFGSASLDGVSDYYSQLIYKQNNLSNPPTPPASLPPTPPPVARQKMVNGFATSEELANKAAIMGGHDVTKSLGPKQIQTPFRAEEDLLARAMAQGPKTVDVPASLPTPPHNNQEELRGQEHCDDRDTPDSFVPSSSPESVVGMEISRYPDLSLVKAEPPSPAHSPVIPMLPSSTGKGSEARQRDVKMEPPGTFFGSQFGQAPNDSRTGLVSIAITLNPAAAENISRVVATMADLLCMKTPCSYEVSNAPDLGPPGPHHHHGPLELRPPAALFRASGPGPQGGARFTRPAGPPGTLQSPLQFPPVGTGPAVGKGDNPTGTRPQWCCHCKVVVLGNGVRKSIKDLPSNKQDFSQVQGGAEGDVVFCSHNCLVLYSSATQSKMADTKEMVALLPPSSFKDSPSKALHQYNNNMSTLDVHCLAQLQPKQSPPSTPPITFPSAAFESAKAEAKPDALKVTVKLKPRPRAVHNADEGSGRPHMKKWKGLRWRKWSVQIVVPKGDFRLPGEDEIDDLLKKLGASLRPEPLPRDLRKCCFCHEEGDGVTDGPARLLNLDLDLWVHLNCALWSTEVYETQAGALINVELALRRGLTIRCAYCQRTGATSGCHRLRCANVYHFTCALRAQCTFFKDKTMLCHQHRPRGGAQEQELRYFAVFRRVYVQRDEVRQLAGVVRRPERDHTFRVGSLIFHAAGQLLPQQMKAFHGPNAIFPAGYEASRIYWSMRHGNRRCRYLCSIDEKDNMPEFSIRVVEQGYEDLVLTDSTPKGVWNKILGPVAERRSESGTLKLFPVYLKGEDLFGLTVSANYTFRYGRNPLMELPLAVNPSGSARSEPKAISHAKRPRTLTSSGSSRSYQSSTGAEIGTPYSKQFVHSKSSQYRRMKSEWKSNVFLACSRIQVACLSHNC
ncbi:hypothetical protein JZ751_000959 [Albula glossodonta]|uniref:[histone H3]-lysine(4) N-methyltransferase n=1 Tax=Albula glossodonta TaxID=121402 RepID=A0A8T2PXM8_9TELE|nr:hypothetical protein JZ751_000959 [Albula glossodonta]